MEKIHVPDKTIIRARNRKDYTKRVALLLLAVCFSVFAGCTRTVEPPSLATQVETLVTPLVDNNEFSGAIVLSRNGSVVFQRGFGMANRSTGLAFTPDTPSDGASLAKTFTAAGVWWLVQEGRIKLDSPVTQYVPDYPHKQTTVRHLLSHSNGLPPYYEFFDPYFAKDEIRTTKSLLQVVAKNAPAPGFPPGTRFEYSNLGFDTAALVIENVTGQSYETFVKERFFSRLGMDNSFARPARFADWKGVRTLGYRWSKNEWQPYDVFDMEAFLGASNLYFSALDLGRWANANAGGTALPAAVVSAGKHRSLIAGKPSSINGLSWYCDDSGARCYYTGSLNAFHSLVYWDRKRNESVVLVTNSSMPPWKVISLQRNLVAILAGRPTDRVAQTPLVTFGEDKLSGAAGNYFAKGFGGAKIEVESSGLSLRLDSGVKLDLFQVSGDVFYAPGADYWIAFGGDTEPSTLYIKSMFLDAELNRVKSDP